MGTKVLSFSMLELIIYGRFPFREDLRNIYFQYNCDKSITITIYSITKECEIDKKVNFNICFQTIIIGTDTCFWKKSLYTLINRYCFFLETIDCYYWLLFEELSIETNLTFERNTQNRLDRLDTQQLGYWKFKEHICLSLNFPFSNSMYYILLLSSYAAVDTTSSVSVSRLSVLVSLKTLLVKMEPYYVTI